MVSLQESQANADLPTQSLRISECDRDLAEIATVIADEREIRNLVGRFHYRDQERWDELADCFWPEATLDISWFSGSIGEFITQSRKISGSGRVILKHLIGTPRVSTNDDRALSETDVTIMLRLQIGDPATPVDITTWCRFHDRHERRGNQWKIIRRTAVYEKDRADPLMPGATIPWTIGQEAMNGLPHQYRNLAAAMKEIGRHLGAAAIVDNSHELRQLEEADSLWLNKRDDAAAA